jgi:HSP20 family protein
MPNVTVSKEPEVEKVPNPFFQDLGARLDLIRQRAYELFEKRRCDLGHALEDWLQAEKEIMGSPASELTDKGDFYEFKIAVPGFNEKNTNVTATSNGIAVHGTAKWEYKGEQDKVLWSEFGTKDFQREFNFPDEIDVNHTTATVENGILLITAPKMAKALSARAA